MAGRVCVVGSFMMDLVAYAPRRPHRGETLVGSSFSMAPGGKGFNQAVAAARAGASVSMIGSLGADDFGAQFLDALRAEGVDARGVESQAEYGTGVGLPLVETDGENSIVIVPRANSVADAALVRRHAALIEGADVLLLQFELPLESAVAAAEIAHGAGTTVVVNPAPAAVLPPGLVGVVDVLTPNEGEAAAMAGARGSEQQNATVLQLASGAGNVVVTLGPRGALLVGPAGTREFAAPTVEAVDTVGAGDVFCGNLAARLAVGDPLPAAVEYAVVAAAVAVTRHGAASAAPTEGETRALMPAPGGTRTPVGGVTS